MPIFDFQNLQGTPGWYKARAGVPTASMFHEVMTPKTHRMSESRKKYACRLIAERLLNWQSTSLDNLENIQNGKAKEPIAVRKMEFVYDIDTIPVGIVKTTDGRFGASPDRISAGWDIVCEVKSPTIPVQMERIIFGDNDAYICQRQGQLLVCEADKAIFFSYEPRCPDYMVESGRDEVFIKKLSDCLEQFSDELEEWTLRARAAGPWQAMVEILSPHETEYADRLAEPE